MDAVHLAGAEIFDCDFFVTCDDKLNALRFLSLHVTLDYMALHQELFEGLTAKEVYENATEFWHNRDKRHLKQED